MFINKLQRDAAVDNATAGPVLVLALPPSPGRGLPGEGAGDIPATLPAPLLAPAGHHHRYHRHDSYSVVEVNTISLLDLVPVLSRGRRRAGYRAVRGGEAGGPGLPGGAGLQEPREGGAALHRSWAAGTDSIAASRGIG